jgi:branched-chain amino acid transport system ATP-binding protein
MMALLEARHIRVRFGGNLVLQDVDFVAEAGRITGLIGPNGAGKTTLFNVMSGLLPPSAGKVVFDGRDVNRLGPSRRARLGIGRTFQRLEMFDHLSVRENVLVAAEFRRSWSRDRTDPVRVTAEIMGRIGIEAVGEARVDSLPTGLCRMVELARALAIRPRLLLLDEPASGQDESETEQFAATLRSIAADGVAVVLVEHDMRLVMDVCEQLHVLDLGRVVAVGSPAEIQAHPHVLAAYLGADMGADTGGAV